MTHVISDFQPGIEVEGYLIEAELGRGGMGIVYRARQVGLEREVALKVIAPQVADDGAFAERFRRESRLAASVEHPQVVPIYEAGERNGVLFIAMRYVRGTDLRTLLRESGRLAPERAVQIVTQIAAGLDAVHSAGLIHRDVKPANVLLAGEDEHAYLTDFGLARQAATSTAATHSGQVLGTLDYMSPEQLRGGRVDARSDIYSLAALLYELLEGRVPFPQTGVETKMYAHLHEPPPRLSSELPSELDAVIGRGMSKAPEDRFLSAGDLARSANAALSGQTVRLKERTVATGEAATGTTAALAAGFEAAPRSDRGTIPTAALAERDHPRIRRPYMALAGLTVLVAIGAAVLIDTNSSTKGHPGSTATGRSGPPITVQRGPAGSAQPSDITVGPSSGALPQAKESISDLVNRLYGVDANVQAGNCGPVNDFNRQSGFALFCNDQGRRAYKDFQVVGSQVYGTGGVIEFTDAEVTNTPRQAPTPGVTPTGTSNVGVFTVALDPSGRYDLTGPVSPILPGSVIGTKPADWTGADVSAVTFLRAIRNWDCSAFFKYSVTPKGLPQDQACKQGLDHAYASLHAQLTSGQRAELFREGGNAQFYFYGVRIASQFRTLVIVKNPPPGPDFLAFGTFRATK